MIGLSPSTSRWCWGTTAGASSRAWPRWSGRWAGRPQHAASLVGELPGLAVPRVAIGGLIDGSLGTDGERVLRALQAAADDAGMAGAVVLMDLGSSVLAVRAAMEELPEEQRARLAVVDGPLVEG